MQHINNYLATEEMIMVSKMIYIIKNMVINTLISLNSKIHSNNSHKHIILNIKIRQYSGDD